MPKSKRMKGNREARGGPLDQVIRSEEEVKASGRRHKERGRKENDDEFVESDLSKKIISLSRKQQMELEEEHGASPPMPPPSTRKGFGKKGGKTVFSLRDADDDEVEITDSDHRCSLAEGMLGPMDVDPDEERAFEVFMSKQGHRTLADIIEDKMTERRTEVNAAMSDTQGPQVNDLHPDVVRVFSKLGDILKSYRSGRLPKALKTLPNSEMWEACLYITRPDQWSAASMNAATRIFSSNLPSALAQRFYSLFLLPRLRDDIAEYKRLNFHLMQALKKSLFKTGGFFKGIVLNLLETGDCTLREALIVCSVIREHSIPVEHAGAAIYMICKMPYTGAASIFLRTLLDKKYALSYTTVDAVCNHFLGFTSEERRLPVLWHQCLLTFAQRYKADLHEGQRSELLGLVRHHFHQEISPEIRRELESAPSTRKLNITS